ncbi:hypothetical protein TSUD_81670 [Trifolium subterraneum]|uniref:Uncharacterized protein n=1 Tax=Trifolium subterraneum TaxID=3900 RepID=A0A2Z6MJU9_TRISU|nr:hypothetical protein TSUD_81670 [Trifolium subterraneum]
MNIEGAAIEAANGDGIEYSRELLERGRKNGEKKKENLEEFVAVDFLPTTTKFA